MMKITILGCGTSTGVPVPGCTCKVCASGDPFNSRLRASVWIQTSDKLSIIVDTSPDFRQQVLRAGVPRVDAVLYTHSHADHILGLDDLRSFNFSQRQSIPCYATETTWKGIERTFKYVFEPDPNYQGGGLPQITKHIFSPGDEIILSGQKVQSFQLFHGQMEVSGFRFGTFAYATDCNHIPEKSMEALQGLDLLILDGLRYEPHPTHFTLKQAIDVARSLGAKRTLFTHYTHSVDYREVSADLPTGFELAVDGMQFDLE